MTPIDAVKSVFTKYATFRGTAARSEYWWWTLFSVVVTGVINAFQGDLDNPNTAASTLGLVWAVGTLIPGLAVTVRRFHDAGFSGKWLFTLLIPVIAFIVSVTQIAELFFDNELAIDADTILSVAGALAPAILLLLAVGIFQLVLTLLPTKTAEKGNKYA
jgi:uncharacterized membrane protein YhaH (DUF805 family)